MLLIFFTSLVLCVTACGRNEEKKKGEAETSTNQSTSIDSHTENSSLPVKQATDTDKTGKVTYILNLKNDDTSITTLTYEKGKVVAQATINPISYAEFKIKDKAEAKKFLSEKQDMLEKVEGVTYSVDYQDKKATETYSIDFTKADPEKIAVITAFAELSTIETAEKLLFEIGYKISE